MTRPEATAEGPGPAPSAVRARAHGPRPHGRRAFTGPARAVLLTAALLPGPAAAAPLGEGGARVLLTRAGFGATRAELTTFAALTRKAAVARLLDGRRETAVSPPPAWTARFESPRGLSRDQRRDWRRREMERGLELRAWWLGEMLSTPSPLTERMTLFWHSHFATSQRKVGSASLMYRQNVLLREHAVGNFGKLLHAVRRDPAMLLYLDGHRNRAGQPNENFAREVMELFTLGPGHYSERDVREAARAFTGLGLDPGSGAVRERPRWHDRGEKTVLGRTGPLSGADVIERLLAHPRTAVHVTEKLWKEFVSPRPDAQAVARIADRFRASGYDLGVALSLLLTSDALYAPENRGVLTKSPVDLVIGTLHTLELDAPDLLPVAMITTRLGQALFAPPDVKGWPGGDAWIDADSLLLRRELLGRVLRAAARGVARVTRPAARPRQMPGTRRARMRARFRAGVARLAFSADAWATGPETDPAAVQRLLMAVPPVTPPTVRRSPVQLLVALTQDPAYQLR